MSKDRELHNDEKKIQGKKGEGGQDKNISADCSCGMEKKHI